MRRMCEDNDARWTGGCTAVRVGRSEMSDGRRSGVESGVYDASEAAGNVQAGVGVVGYRVCEFCTLEAEGVCKLNTNRWWWGEGGG